MNWARAQFYAWLQPDLSERVIVIWLDGQLLAPTSQCSNSRVGPPIVRHDRIR